MQAVCFDQCGLPAEVLAVRERDASNPDAGEVRVRMLASPINPSDLMFVQGSYGQQPVFPAIPGFEGVGIVEASGGGLLGKFMIGKRVAVLNRRGGNWAEQVVLPANQVVPLARSLSIEQAATFFINPMSAVVMSEKIHRLRRGEWLLQSAAGSALGRMMIRLGRETGFRTLNIVRRAEQIDELCSLGADDVIVFDASTDHPDELVQRILRQTGGVRCAIDPVGGIVGSALCRCLRERGRLLVYGSLAEQPLQLSPRTLITSRAAVEGFWLGPWMLTRSLPSKLRLIRRVTQLIQRGALTSEVSEIFALPEIRAAVAAATAPSRTGKVLLRMR
ncbi:MAG: zinc-dependent alcohol dehydrogenase family protein [Planctomycetaceae bacterium]